MSTWACASRRVWGVGEQQAEPPQACDPAFFQERSWLPSTTDDLLAQQSINVGGMSREMADPRVKEKCSSFTWDIHCMENFLVKWGSNSVTDILEAQTASHAQTSHLEGSCSGCHALLLWFSNSQSFLNLNIMHLVLSGWPWWPPDELVSMEPDRTSGVWVTNRSWGLRDKNTEAKVRSNKWARCCSHKNKPSIGAWQVHGIHSCAQNVSGPRDSGTTAQETSAQARPLQKGGLFNSSPVTWTLDSNQRQAFSLTWNYLSPKSLLLVACSVPAPVCEQDALLCACHKGPQRNFLGDEDFLSK